MALGASACAKDMYGELGYRGLRGLLTTYFAILLACQNSFVQDLTLGKVRQDG